MIAVELMSTAITVHCLKKFIILILIGRTNLYSVWFIQVQPAFHHGFEGMSAAWSISVWCRASGHFKINFETTKPVK
jgi:hypothetical protein